MLESKKAAGSSAEATAPNGITGEGGQTPKAAKGVQSALSKR